MLGLLVALAVVPALTAATWFGIIQPQVGRGSTLGWVAATVAIAFAIQSFVSVVFARPAYVFPDPIPFHDAGRDGVVTVAGATFQLRSLYVIALGVALALLVEYVVGRTRFGRGSRRSPRTPRAHPWSAFRTTASSASRLRSSAGSRS